MSQKLIRAALMALFTMFASPTWASELPTSENPATGDWTRMRPTSFEPTIESAREQCDRTAAENANDRLTPAHCERLEQQLRAKQCRQVAVKDGVVFDFMNGRESGHSRVTRHIKKKLGREDPALLCDLGDRVVAYWFVGNGKSCHNVGFAFVAPPPVNGACGENAKRYLHTDTGWPAEGKLCSSGTSSPSSILFPEAGKTTAWACEGSGGGSKDLCTASREEAPPPPKVVKAPPKQCVMVKRRYVVSEPGQFIHIPGLSVAVCRGQVYIPDNFVNVPASVMVVSKDEEVCN